MTNPQYIRELIYLSVDSARNKVITLNLKAYILFITSNFGVSMRTIFYSFW